MKRLLNRQFETAVRLLVEHMPISPEDSRKPILFHDIRVGVFLYEREYSREIVLAGLLHDAIEWSSLMMDAIRETFGDEVARLILASTKDDTIADKTKKTNELICRCIDAGEDALIVKTADILDSFKWYSSTENIGELKYCLRNADAILSGKPLSFDDPLFDELKIWNEKYAHLSD